MANISTDRLRIRRAVFVTEIAALAARVAEIDHWLEAAGVTDRDLPVGYLGAGVVGTPGSPTVVQARNPRQIKKDKQSA